MEAMVTAITASVNFDTIVQGVAAIFASYVAAKVTIVGGTWIYKTISKV